MTAPMLLHSRKSEKSRAVSSEVVEISGTQQKAIWMSSMTIAGAPRLCA